MHGLSAFLTGSLDETLACYQELAQYPGASLAEKLEADNFLARVAFRKALL